VAQPDLPVALGQINIIVRDMARSLAFYRLLGVSVEAMTVAEWAPHHANGTTANGVPIEFDSVAFAKAWNPGVDETRLGSAVLPFFQVAARADVDRVHARLTAAGYPSQKGPEDAFWGARYAIVADPDGNAVGITSAIDATKAFLPPPPPNGSA
jgi:catechol 2,3-dioxygenase-like lactoylglutathione lyase family enzyme